MSWHALVMTLLICRKQHDDGTYVCKLLQIDAIARLINIIYSEVVYQAV
jgi:hypothetical protein